MSDESTPGPAGELGPDDQARLLRIGVMLRELRDEVSRVSPDEAGLDLLHQIHTRAVDQVCGSLSEDLRDELADLALPLGDGRPTESEVRLAQAQLIGWLEGLFQGIQAAVVGRQLQARQQLADQQRQQGALAPGQAQQSRPGQYL